MDDDISIPEEVVLETPAEEGAVVLSDLVAWNFAVTEDMPPSEALLSWYSNLPSSQLDLVGELGDSRGAFVVSGDAMLAHILAQHTPEFSSDLNFLTPVFFAEQYVDMFRRAKGGLDSGIRVVFFDCFRFFFAGESEGCLRELLVAHLAAVLGPDCVRVFANWKSPEFEKFATATDISTVIIGDEGDAAQTDEESEKLVQSMFLALALHLVTVNRLRIAFFDQLEQRGSRIVALSVGPERRHEGVYAKLDPVMVEMLAMCQLEDEVPEVIGGKATASPFEMITGGVRATIADLSESDPNVLIVLKSILVSSFLQSRLALADRALATIRPHQWEGVFGQEEGLFALVWNQVAVNMGYLLRDAKNFHKNNITDLFDGRLWRTVVFCMWQNGVFAGQASLEHVLGLSGEELAELAQVWATISGTAEFGDFGMEVPAPSIDALPLVESHEASTRWVPLTGRFALIDRAAAITAQLSGGDPLASFSSGDAEFIPPHSLPGAYIPETQLVTRRFEDKKRRDYEEQRLKWKHLSIDKLAGRMRQWELRGAQKELRAMHQYAESLAGANSLHHPIALVQPGGRVAVAEEPVRVSKKAAEIIAKNVATQQKNQTNKDTDQIKPLIERAEQLVDSRDFAALAAALLDLCAGSPRIMDSFDGFKGICASVKLEASQVKVIAAAVKAAAKALKKLVPSACSHMAKEETKLAARTTCAKILRLCTSFVQEYAEFIEGKEIVRVQELLIALGFTHSSKNLFSFWKAKNEQAVAPEDEDAKKKKKDGKEGKEAKSSSKKAPAPQVDDSEQKSKSSKSPLDEFYVKSSKVDELVDITGGDEFLFQLIHLNAELDRPAGTLSDKRVMFKPDYWQRELLDIVDKNESALVCAPTASGKTFICYYAMEKVLRSSNDKVAVYVAPSKALMNQVDAEIYARFRSKTYPATDSVHLLGDLEKDYQHNPFNCQVLVTIPSMLEQLLLDPTMQEWVKKIEYVIFDEVHVMGESAEESAIWEHALQLIPCPFLAMSATVGNPSKFHDWLNFVAKIKNGPKVHLIEYKERFNDLAKFAFAPEEQALLSIHPFTVLSYEDVLSGVIPPDLTMTPAELALLVAVTRKAIVENAADVETASDIAKKISPRKVFEKIIPVDTMVSKRQFRAYEQFILGEFIRLNAAGVIDRNVFGQIQKSLCLSPRIGDAKSANELWQMVSSSKLSAGQKSSVDVSHALGQVSEPHYLREAWLFSFLAQLDRASLLPAIIFNLDRAEIMKMVERLATLLKHRQDEKFYGSEERAYATRAINKKRMDAYEAQVARRKLMERKNKKDEDFDEAETTESIPMPKMVEEEFDADFSFAGVKAQNDSECTEMIDRLAENKKIKPWIIEALRRGIGMHHEGCSTRLKKTVEVLFRRGFLRVVVATGTLSLGINMPCKSTIFVGTHVKLNALSYRQMAGRAGRRGFDLLGHVIFVDSTQKNIRRLLTSELTQLGGDFALTPSHVLRAHIMLKHLEGSKDIVQTENRLMAMLLGGFLPFNVNSSSSFVILRSTIDFLVREGLLTPSGQVTRLGSLAAFLFKREPENFVVSRVLLSRELQTEVDRWIAEERADQPTSAATFKLMQVLSSLCFTRTQLRGAATRKIPQRKRLQPIATCPLLPPVDTVLPEALSKVREDFNQRAIESVVGRLRVQTAGDTTAEALPLSGFTGEKVSKSFGKCALQETLTAQQLKQTIQLRSVFSALAGKTDRFETAQDLVLGSRQRPELMLDSAAVPTVPLGPTSSYACDFLLHGKLSLLQNDCLIGVSESWKEIDEWRFFLESLNIALEFMFESDNTHEYANLHKLVRDLTNEITSKLHSEGA